MSLRDVDCLLCNTLLHPYSATSLEHYLITDVWRNSRSADELATVTSRVSFFAPTDKTGDVYVRGDSPSHTHTHTYTHTQLTQHNTHTHTPWHTYTHAHIHIHIHTHTHTLYIFMQRQ
jgi:hypothetical protein